MPNRFLVALVDRNHGHIYDFDSDTCRVEFLEEIVDEVPKQVKAASWAGMGNDKVARHIENHVQEHYKNVADYLEKRWQKDHFQLIVGGQEENLAEFSKCLPNPIKDSIIGEIRPDVHSNDLKQLEKILCEAVSQYDQKNIQQILSQIEESRQPSGKGVVGLEPVCEALNLREVDTVVIGDGAKISGYYCAKDGAISTLSTTCPHCMSEMLETNDLEEKILESINAQKARFIKTQSLPQLVKMGNIAALRRYTA